jgi:integrase
MRVHIKGVNVATKRLADGSKKRYYYHRATGIRLDGEPQSPEFIASYARAEAATQNRLAGTFSALVREFTSSKEFEQKAKSTRAEYTRMLRSAEDEFGTMPIGALNDPKVRGVFLDWHEKAARSSGEREADNRLSALSAMLTWAVDRRKITHNHVRGFKRLYHGNRAEIIWLPEHVEAFLAVAPPELHLALMLAMHTGQRQADLLKLAWSSYDGTHIRLRQGKARRANKPARLIEIPCTPALKKMLDSMKPNAKSPLILTTRTGRAFKKRYFIRLWDDATKKAGLDLVDLPGLEQPVKLHFHDVRGTTVTILAETGCTTPEIASITEHSLRTVERHKEHNKPRQRELEEQ